MKTQYISILDHIELHFSIRKTEITAVVTAGLVKQKSSKGTRFGSRYEL